MCWHQKIKPVGSVDSLDILEFGAALVEATPSLKRTIAELTTDPDDGRRLLQATLKKAWLSRQRLAVGSRADLHPELLRTLRSQVLH